MHWLSLIFSEHSICFLFHQGILWLGIYICAILFCTQCADNNHASCSIWCFFFLYCHDGSFVFRGKRTTLPCNQFWYTLYRRVIILHLTHQLQACNDSVCISALTSPKCQTMLAKESYLDPLKMAKEAAAIVFTISSTLN